MRRVNKKISKKKDLSFRLTPRTAALKLLVWESDSKKAPPPLDHENVITNLLIAGII